jgi:hypothetical protein
MSIESRHPTRNSGCFRKGHSGNPAGRPRGARNKATLAAEALLEGEMEQLVRVALGRALGGDSVLLRFFLSRVLPAPRGRRVALDLAVGSDAAAVVASLATVVQTVAVGAISPLEGCDVARLLEAQRSAVMTVDLTRRLARLEEAVRGSSGSPGDAAGDAMEGDGPRHDRSSPAGRLSSPLEAGEARSGDRGAGEARRPILSGADVQAARPPHPDLSPEGRGRAIAKREAAVGGCAAVAGGRARDCRIRRASTTSPPSRSCIFPVFNRRCGRRAHAAFAPSSDSARPALSCGRHCASDPVCAPPPGAAAKKRLAGRGPPPILRGESEPTGG